MIDFAQPIPQVSPGPAQYNIPSSIGKDSPKISFLSAKAHDIFRIKDFTPGPGAYFKSDRLERPMRSTSFSKAERTIDFRDRSKLYMPGPG